MMFEAYVTNLGMYPERGVEVGEYLKFPTTIEEVQALFSRIGIDGKRYRHYGGCPQSAFYRQAEGQPHNEGAYP